MIGLVLTDTTDLGATLRDLRAADVPLIKVVTAWGYSWTDSAIAQVCAVPEIIIRTASGDGCRPPPDGQAGVYPIPDVVLAELEPWLFARPNAMVEIGNEGNMWDDSDEAAWVYRWHFAQSAMAVRQRWPAARIMTGGLCDKRLAEWLDICGQVDPDSMGFREADILSGHVYAWHDFVPSDTGQIQHLTGLLRTYYADMPWSITEAGINDTNTSDDTKAARYGTLSRGVHTQFEHTCCYHICARPSDADQSAYALAPPSWKQLKAIGSI